MPIRFSLAFVLEVMGVASVSPPAFAMDHNVFWQSSGGKGALSFEAIRRQLHAT